MIITNYSDLYKDDFSLRPYQQKAKKEIFESWDEVDSVMFQMPTGTGKTRLFTSIISDINKYSIQRKEAVKILIIAHRTELIDQIDLSLDKYHVAHNIIAGGRERNIKYPVSVASIQTITNARNLNDAKKLKVQFVIIDEAHHALASSYKKLWDLYPEAKRLGVTATPWRMNHQTFTDLFDKLVLSMPIKDFIKQGYLAPYKYFSLKSDSDIQRTIDDIELDRFGEYKESSMEEKMDIGSIRAQLLDSYLSLAEGKKGIIYAINIAHANHICQEYEHAGYKAVSIDSKTPAAERKELVDKFKKSEIDIIVNVDIFSEGFDCPDIEFIQLARPTRSLVKYLQQVGRGLRPTENKQNCVILDNVGMYSRFGLPDARRHWKYHFLGKQVDEEPVKVVSKGTGKSRYVDLSEGTEDMELIQDTIEDVEPVVDDQDKTEIINSDNFDPIQLLESYNFSCENFIFYFIQSQRIYETYIQDDKYFIVSELVVDKMNNCVHRNRVGKISSDSWMYWQFLREKIDNLKSITHYGANYTVFHYRVISAETNQEKDKYFDYKGREIESPEVVSIKYMQANKQEKLNDYVDVPVSKAEFKIVLQSSVYTLYKTVKGVTKPIAKMLSTSNFGFSYELDVALKNAERMSNGLPQIRLHNTGHIAVVRSDESSFTIKKIEKGKGLLLKYDLEGKLLQTGTLASKTVIKNNPLQADDIEKMKHAFDKKSTSYKFFWFMSLLDIYKETQVANISFRQILIKMTAKAWKYVFLLNGRFSQSDQLPLYLKTVMESAKIKFNATETEVEAILDSNYEKLKMKSILCPLLKNVPFRFLSPWIVFTSNDEVMKKSWDKDSRCPYELYEDHIIVSELWGEAFIDLYDTLQLLAEYKLEAYLNVYQNAKEAYDFYNTRFTSLSQLLKGIKRRKNQKTVKLFLEKYGFSLNGDISTTEILNKIPESKCNIDGDGRKQVNLPGDLWSLNILDKLLSEDDLHDTYDNINLLKGHGLEKFLNNGEVVVNPNELLYTKFVSLSKLLNYIHENKEAKVIKDFLLKYNLSLNEKLKPSDILNIMPESNYTLDGDGRKQVIVPGGMWSLDILDKLLAG